MDKPEALRLADELDHGVGTIDRVRHEAAAELRRLHAQRDALLEALKEMLAVWEDDPAYGSASAEKARAAIAKAEGEKA